MVKYSNNLQSFCLAFLLVLVCVTVSLEKVKDSKEKAEVVTTCDSSCVNENYKPQMLITSSSCYAPPLPVATSVSFDHSIPVENSFIYNQSVEGSMIKRKEINDKLYYVLTGI